MRPSFLDLPPELRLQIYDDFLDEHQRVRLRTQPSNAHIRLLHTCRLIAEEAGSSFRRYISLLHEHQIHAFVLYTDPAFCAQIAWADVANDGRVFHSSANDQPETVTPLSNLHIALARMTALKRLRVFQCRQGLPINLQNTMSLHRSRRLGLKFERAMFPKDALSPSYYELYVSPETRVDLFQAINPSNIVALRYSGEMVGQKRRKRDGPPDSMSMSMPALRHVVLQGVTGNYFDRQTIDECFPDAHIESFSYALGHRLGFEIRNQHLESLVASHGLRLRKLVLLGCNRLSSTVITQSLENLPVLQFFALHMVTVDDLRSNFVRALPPSLTAFKLQVINAWYASPLLAQERDLCEAFEGEILQRDTPLASVYVCFRDKLLVEGGRKDRWKQIAEDRRFRLHIGPWEDQMMEDM
ncbi:hypothetical protein C8Q80DRAFT_1264661 [Daedaleopsis nitida]|nr:hypothetical protein C8Q80DRAFT_1264661 [Daedaleopsis nitida]